MKIAVAALTLAAAISSARATPVTFTDTLGPSSLGTGIIIRPFQHNNIVF